MRLIDAEPIERWLLLQADKSIGKNPYEKARICAFRRAFEAIQGAPTIAPQPNVPLTPDELRGIDGEPVWAELLIGHHPSHWAIIHGEMVCDGRFLDDRERCVLSFGKNGAYGIGWLAYRRRPEEAPHDQ